MKKKRTPVLRTERSRWIIIAGAAVLLWSTWSYCAGDNMALFFATAVFAVLAAISKRNLPRSARWVIWIWVIVAVVCLAANVNRLVPVEGDQGGGFIFDRVATALFSIGICPLFFFFGKLQVSLIAVASMPLVMLALRERNGTALSSVYQQLIVWGFILLVVILDYTCRATRPSELGGGTRITFKKGRVRWLWLLLALCAAYGIRTPVELASVGLQRIVNGISYSSRSKKQSPMNVATGLYLSRPLPKGYRKRMRLLLLIDSNRIPGYLRVNVFTKYQNGNWLIPEKGGERLTAVNTALDNESDKMTFSLTGETTQRVLDEWGIEVLAPKIVSSLCLPGSAISISSHDPSPLANSNGVVTVDDEYFFQYRVGIGERYGFMTACQKSDGFSDPAYLDVPLKISSAVSNWVGDCTGIGGDFSVLESKVNVQNYFKTNFTYSTAVQINKRPDPLINFMKQRKGICVHFASAAALMFRSAGIPSRVVVGYVSMEWNPWIKRFVTREREGHAWVEVWDEQHKKWILVEPTPPAGIPINRGPSGVMQLAMDMLSTAWKRLIAWISSVNILVLIAGASASLFLFIMDLALSPWGIALVIGLLSFVWWRRRKLRSILTDEEQLRTELTTMMHKTAHRALPSDYKIHKAECWDSWLKRVKDHLPADSYAGLSEILESYQLLRYSKQLDVTAAKEWLMRVEK